MSEDKYAQAVLKIFRMTHEGNLKWHHGKAPAIWSMATDSVYPIYFETEYQGRTLALFEERFPVLKMPKALSTSIFGDDRNWGSRARLALLGPHDEIMFEFPYVREIQGLLDAVRYKEADVEEFLDEILKT